MSKDPTEPNGPPGDHATTSLAGANPPTEPLTIGARGRFRGEELVGRGGMGAVFAAHDQLMDRRVAVKVLHPDLAERPAEVSAFLREAQFTGALDHPNVVPVYDLVDDAEGSTCFIMKLVEGETLADYIKGLGSGPLDGEAVEFVVGVLIKVCDALSFAHARGVLHLDIKPSNIMIGSHGQAYLMDWGVARRLARCDEESSDMEVSLPVRGTMAYMAPEQAVGAVRDIDERTDVYALGGVLYVFLTGRPPFEPRGVLADVVNLVDAEVLDPLEAPTLRQPPPGLAAIAMKALSRKPSERHSSVADFVADLRQFLRGGGWFPSKYFEAGQVIVREGDPGEEAYVITHGRCEVTRSKGRGEQTRLRTMGPGEIFGETAILTRGVRTASVRALEDVTVMVITAQALDRELDRRGWLGTLVRALAERFLEADEERTRLRARRGSDESSSRKG